MDAGIGSDFDEPLPVDRKMVDKIIHSHEGVNCCGRYAHLTCEPKATSFRPFMVLPWFPSLSR